MGRILLIATGVVLLSVAGAFAYLVPGEQTSLVVVAVVIGFAQIWLAMAGSDRAWAFFGFFAPWWP